MSDKIHPDHYKKHAVLVDGVFYEPIAICECYNFCIGNAVKYLLRADAHKDGEAVNLQKARYYLDRESRHDFYNYCSMLPDGDNRYTVSGIIDAHRNDNAYINALFTGVAEVNTFTLENTIKLIDKRLEVLNASI